MLHKSELQLKGWTKFSLDNDIVHWITEALPYCRRISEDKKNIKNWMRCGGTWFAGVNIIENNLKGSIAGGPSLTGRVIDFVDKNFSSGIEWDQGQLSIVYEGYPKPNPLESSSATRFRIKRDAAHVDGLLPIGSQRKRMLREPHAFILGIPMTVADTNCSPLVVWEGSNKIIRDYFTKALSSYNESDWGKVDLTETYKEARKVCFEECKRVIVHGWPGETYLIHRLSLHGIAPWSFKGKKPMDGRMICYFRPHLDNLSDWLN